MNRPLGVELMEVPPFPQQLLWLDIEMTGPEDLVRDKILHIAGVSGDFGFNNTLAKNGKITGVIDWDDAAYGDPLYDVAWQGFWSAGFSWSEDIDIVGAIKQQYVQNGQLPEYFDERVDCYKMIIGTNCLSFFAKSDQKGSYDFARGELLKIDAKKL